MKTNSPASCRAVSLWFALVLLPAALPASPPVIGSFTSSKTAIMRGENVTLNWNVTGATALTLRPPLLTVTGNSHTFAATGTQVYTLTATNADGSTTAKVKLYDLNQKAFFTDTVLMTGRASAGPAFAEERDWSGQRLKQLTITPYCVYDSAMTPDGTLLVTGSDDGGVSGVFAYDPVFAIWTWHPLPGVFFGYATTGDITVLGESAIFGQRSFNLEDLTAQFQISQSSEMIAGGDGQVHRATDSTRPESLDFFDRETGVIRGQYSLAGVGFPFEDLSTGNMRIDALDVTADGERFIGTLGGRLFRLSGQPALLRGSIDVQPPGAAFRASVADVQVAPDGKLIAGSRSNWALLTDRQFSNPRYIEAGDTHFLYTTFTTTGLIRPRVEYFRAMYSSVAPGTQTELTWLVGGAATVDIEGVGTGLPPEGSAMVMVPATSVFELMASNQWGTTTAEAVILAGEPPVISSFTANSLTPPLGVSVSVAWSIAGADRAWISPGLGSQSPQSDSLSYTAVQRTTLWLTAENEFGRSRASLTITPGSPAGGSERVELIPWRSMWFWLHPLNGVDPATTDADFRTTWMTPASYNGPDFQGPSPQMFSYGTLDWGMPIMPLTAPPSGLRYTAYFRGAFTVPGGLGPVVAETQIDDGCVIYVDGAEKGRFNYNGPDTYRGLTPTFSDENGYDLTSLGVLPSGARWLGVSVHNYTNDSSDLAFALRLYGNYPWYGLPPNAAGLRSITFEEADAGALAYTAGSNGTADAGWSQQAGNAGRVAQYPWGRALHLSAGTTRLTSDVIDLRELINESARVDVKTWQSTGGNGYETADSIEAWVEGTSDGLSYTRLATLIPLRRGGTPADQIAPLDTGEDGAFTRFTTAAGAIGSQWKAARIVFHAVNDHATEHFVFDNLAIEGTPPSVDSDSDGLSDVWEHTWFAGLGAVAGSGDADSDGHSNTAEQIAGTNPLLAASRLDYMAVSFPTPLREGEVTWMSVPGKTYNLQRSLDMVTWENLETGIPAEGAATTTPFPRGLKAPHRYYRVRANP